MDRDTRKVAIQLAYASSIGIALVLFIFGSLWLGVWLDGKFGTGYKVTILLVVIGVGAGFWNIYGLIKKFSWDEKPIIKYLKSEPHGKRPPPKKA